MTKRKLRVVRILVEWRSGCKFLGNGHFDRIEVGNWCAARRRGPVRRGCRMVSLSGAKAASRVSPSRGKIDFGIFRAGLLK